MSSNGLVSIYMGTPQLEQLNDDLRAAEMFREAPRILAQETSREACWEGGKLYKLVDNRDVHFTASCEAALSDRSLGTFRLGTGGLAYFVLRT